VDSPGANRLPASPRRSTCHSAHRPPSPPCAGRTRRAKGKARSWTPDRAPPAGSAGAAGAVPPAEAAIARAQRKRAGSCSVSSTIACFRNGRCLRRGHGSDYRANRIEVRGSGSATRARGVPGAPLRTAPRSGRGGDGAIAATQRRFPDQLSIAFRSMATNAPSCSARQAPADPETGRQAQEGGSTWAQGDRPVRRGGLSHPRHPPATRRTRETARHRATRRAGPAEDPPHRRDHLVAGNRDLAAQSRRSLDRKLETLQLGLHSVIGLWTFRVCSHLGNFRNLSRVAEPFTSAADYLQPGVEYKGWRWGDDLCLDCPPALRAVCRVPVKTLVRVWGFRRLLFVTGAVMWWNRVLRPARDPKKGNFEIGQICISNPNQKSQIGLPERNGTCIFCAPWRPTQEIPTRSSND